MQQLQNVFAEKNHLAPRIEIPNENGPEAELKTLGKRQNNLPNLFMNTEAYMKYHVIFVLQSGYQKT